MNKLIFLVAMSSAALTSMQLQASEQKILTEDTAKKLLENSYCNGSFKPTVYFSERPKKHSYVLNEDGSMVFSSGNLKECSTGEQEYGSFCVEVLCTKPLKETEE
ncbi:hypothetical protein [Alteromonas gracilis]|uniref:hypothetical protein n=1 Tax=Alteromonas gracilis TaxID=1479524 RepID=UPI003735E7C5